MHHLQLAFNKTSKNSIKGYSFDTNSQNYNVLLGNRGAHSISEVHFYITFDDTIDYKKHLILRDLLVNGIVISYSSQVEGKVRHHFT